MADPNQNPPPLLLFSANDSLAPDAFRPVPATAALFPTEDGEADSFLGQTDDPTIGHPSQPQVPLFTTQSAAGISDPFANINQPASLPSVGQQGSASGLPTQPPALNPSTTHQSVSFSGPSTQQYYSGPPTGPSMFGSPMSGPPTYGPPTSGPSTSMPHDPSAPPPTAAPQGRTGGFGGVKLGQAYQTVLHPMGMGGPGPSTSTPMGGHPIQPPVQPMFDPTRPPPISTELQQSHSSHQASELPIHQTHGSPGTHYHPVQPHWFYCKESDRGQMWYPFSILDSIKLDDALHASYHSVTGDTIISTNGGRYDVNIQQRLRHAVYWDEPPSIVRRCTWFYKSDGENRFLPYEEGLADKLEHEYKSAIVNNVWHKRLEFADGETIVMHNPNVIVHFRPPSRPDDFGTSPDGQMRPRVVKRGVDDAENIDQGEPSKVDHIVFVVHGIGPVCDLRFRSIVECVDELRSVSLGLMRSHFKHSQDDGRTGRTEFLPVYWYEALHGDATGVDRRLRRITLPSITRLRRFTNDTLLDILFYSSPSYSQKIAEHVCSEINRLYELFQQRNPEFKGGSSLVGHSLGSLIVFDLLSHQGNGHPNLDTTASHAPITPDQSAAAAADELAENLANEEAEEEVMTLDSALDQLGLTEFLPKFQEERIDMESLMMCGDSDLKEMGLPLGPRKKLGGFLKEQATKEEKKRKAQEARIRAEAARAAREALELERQEASLSQLTLSAQSIHIDYELGSEGVGQPLVKYSQLSFKPQCFFAIGSPIGMFLTVRGVSRVGEEYKLPTCDGFFNIFHPFDPVAYRIEPLVHADMADVKPFLMPHHKGRKRFHLELRESLSAFGSDLKRSLLDSMKRTWKSIHQFALAHRSGAEEDSVPEVTAEEMEAVAEKLSMEELARQERERDGLSAREPAASADYELKLGQLNSGRRIDYVLQEAPLESFNEYLFALGSHTCYWDSEDTVLLILKEVYASLGVFPLVQGPKQDSAPPTPLHN